ncbi:MAG TPA: ATP-binding protein, partial [Segetibacter sp.]
MNLKTRLSLLYSLSVFIILLVSAMSVYVFNENFRRNEFSRRLVAEAKENEPLFYSLPKLSPQIGEQLKQNAGNSLENQKISIYDPFFHLIYSTAGKNHLQISFNQFFDAQKNGLISLNVGEEEAILLHKLQHGKSFFILVSAVDFFGHSKINNLRVILILSVAGGILLSGLLAFFYVRQAMKPLEELKGQIEKINEENLKQRIPVKENNNEISEIAHKFNAMLDRLEYAFEQRKNFVHHASHELRTPLASMLAQTESALNKRDLSKDGYRVTLESLKEDQQEMIELTNSLLTLSGYEKITVKNDWTSVRIDEVLYEIAEFLNEIWPEARITIDFETIPENDNLLVFDSNESLIKSALQNLVKNAIQYSEDAKVSIIISAAEEGITLHFDNAGRQLTAEEQKSLFIPFFRGQNSHKKKGFGLGLSIVERIIKVHEARINYLAISNNINR